MSYLLFMDESGHDHQNMPYEVRGGICVHSKKIASLLRNIEVAEKKAFGCLLSEFQTEIKGAKLLRKERFKWAAQGLPLTDEQRQRGCRRFLTACLEKRSPTKEDFTAYGQASLLMVDNIFSLLKQYKVKIIASCIKKGTQKPKNFKFENFLRKDHCYLFERFFFLLKVCKEDGLVIMDQVEKALDKKFSRQLKSFLYKSPFGRKLGVKIVPEPLFIESDISSLIQVADVCIYAINTGYRKATALKEPHREEVRTRFENIIHELQFYCNQYKYKNGKRVSYPLWGITFTPKPYTEEKRRGNAV